MVDHIEICNKKTIIYFDQFIGLETKEKEYKLAVLNLDDDMSDKYILFLLKTGKWIFNKHIYNTIYFYLHKYLPKYISSFTNIKSHVDKGVIYIGVNDNGYVKGIPFNGSINMKFINNCVRNVINSKKVLFPSKKIRNYFKYNIKVELIDIEFDRNNIISTKCNLYENLIDEFYCKVKIKEHKKKFKTMVSNLLLKQTEKLSNVINRERSEFLTYLKDFQFFNKSKYKHTYTSLEYLDLANVPTYYELIADIKIKKFKQTSNKIVINYNFIKDCEKSQLISSEINNCIIMYFVGKYKDYCVKALKIIKIKDNENLQNEIYPKCLIRQIDKMIPIWINFNPSLKLYLLKIEIPKNIYCENKNIRFLCNRGYYRECYRDILNDQPITKYW